MSPSEPAPSKPAPPRTLVIDDYDPKWATAFAEIAEALSSIVGACLIRRTRTITA